jgi:membrane protease YdiL (CAAX protease family)
LKGLLRRLRIGELDPRESLLDVRRVGRVPPWAVVATVVALYLATLAANYREYRRDGTVFGYPGPGINALFAPIYEELIFRGWLLGRLARAVGAPRAIVVTSLLFGLLHLRNVYWREPEALVQQVLYTGLVFGPLAAYVTLKTRSVWTAVALHYANNLTWYL